jgi:phenylalanyl-tRNA synthetase beta chain
MNVLRPSLLPGLLDTLRHNLSHKVHDVALFEVGRVFIPNSKAAREERRIAIALTGQRQATFWAGDDRQATFDVYDLKGLVEEFLENLGIRGVSYARRPAPTTALVESATVQLGKQPLGEMGQLLPSLARQCDLRDAVLLAEFNLDLLLARRATGKSFKPLPAFPAIRRDVAMIIGGDVTHEAVLAAVKQVKAANLESVELFDVFRGKNVPAGQKSVAYAFTYRHPERTLTDAEVNSAHERVTSELKRVLNALMRE